MISFSDFLERLSAFLGVHDTFEVVSTDPWTIKWGGEEYLVDPEIAMESLSRDSNLKSPSRVAQCLYFSHPSRREVLEGAAKKVRKKRSVLVRMHQCFFCGDDFTEPKYRKDQQVKACLKCLDLLVQMAPSDWNGSPADYLMRIVARIRRCSPLILRIGEQSTPDTGMLGCR
jgi:hypothetical protein